MTKKEHKLAKFEIFWYSLCGLLGIWGFVYVILGLVGNAQESGNSLQKASERIAAKYNLGFIGWGLIIFCIATALAIIVLLRFAKKSDRESEKSTRRLARLQAAEEAKKTRDQVIVEAEVAPVEDK